MRSPGCYPAPGSVAVLLVMLRELRPIFSYILLSGLTQHSRPGSSAGRGGGLELAGGEKTEDGNSSSCLMEPYFKTMHLHTEIT